MKILFAAVLLQGLTVRAQINDKMIIRAGDSLSRYRSYLFPSFGEATVKMRDGRSVNYMMNFNLLLCDMQFIDQTGDTMVITNPADIDSVLLDSCSFIYDYRKGYFQILAVSEAVSLAVHRQTTFEPVPIGDMRSNASTGGVEMVNSITNRQGTIPLALNEDMYVLKNTSFVLYYKDHEVEYARKAALMKIYNGDKRSFDQFIKANKLDLNKQDDIERLFHFCTQSKN